MIKVNMSYCEFLLLRTLEFSGFVYDTMVHGGNLRTESDFVLHFEPDHGDRCYLSLKSYRKNWQSEDLHYTGAHTATPESRITALEHRS